jgi:MoxR-like ATPase
MNIQIKSITVNKNSADYVADEPLIKAIEIALALGKPLLVSGEPGTGKTRLADYVAWQLARQTSNMANAFLEKPFVFHTKSTSVATDLFYYYDAVSHFRNQQPSSSAEQFIELRAMGLAIAQTLGFDSSQLQNTLKGIRNFNEKNIERPALSSVVLIDEIDKAPREFPNDLLNEIENYEFELKELNQTVSRGNNLSRILVILTSNSEKNLPNAFLRRCIFYHIEFPDKLKLLDIAKKRLTIDNETYDPLILKAIDQFNLLRGQAINKKPSTSEFLDWLNVLKDYGLLDTGVKEADQISAAFFESSKSVLIKNAEDLQAVNHKSIA